MKNLYFALFATALSVSAHAGTRNDFHCYGKSGDTLIAADVFEAVSRQLYFKVTSDNQTRVFLVTDPNPNGSLFFTGTEVDPISGSELGINATLQIPQILMNKGSLQIGSQKVSLQCVSTQGSGLTHAL